MSHRKTTLTGMVLSILTIMSFQQASAAADRIIIKAKHSGRYLSVNAVLANYPVIQRFTTIDDSRQRFDLNHLGNGVVTLTAAGSQLCVTIVGTNSKDWVAVQLKNCNSSDAAQKFLMTKASDGSYEIKTFSGSAKYCVSIESASTASSAKAVQMACNGAGEQRFFFYYADGKAYSLPGTAPVTTTTTTSTTTTTTLPAPVTTTLPPAPVTTTTTLPPAPVTTTTLPNVSYLGGSLLSSKAELDRAKVRYASKQGPLYESCNAILNRANNNGASNPFIMANISRDMTWDSYYNQYGCKDTTTAINTTGEYSNLARNDFANAVASSYKYFFTGDKVSGANAMAIMDAWAARATIPNLYDHFNMSFPATGSSNVPNFDGKDVVTCRKVNFALDFGWTARALRALAESYMLLDRNGYPMTSVQRTNIKSLIKKIAASVDSSMDSWTEPYRLYGNSYRGSHNHVIEYMGGMVAAAAALNDAAMFEYIINGSTYNFGTNNNKVNGVSLKKYLDLALILEPGTNNVGLIDINEKTTNYRVYHGNVVAAMGTVFRMIDLYYPKEAGLYEGYKTPKGYSAMMTAKTFAGYIIGDVAYGGTSDKPSSLFYGQVGLEYAQNMTKDANLKKYFQRALLMQLSGGNVRSQNYVDFTTSTCVQGADF